MDLSSREDAVVYKPNPFSIAKINAASRATHAAAPVVVSRPSRPVTRKPKGPIVDSFKKMEEKKLNTFGTQLPSTKSVLPALTIPRPMSINLDMTPHDSTILPSNSSQRVVVNPLTEPLSDAPHLPPQERELQSTLNRFCPIASPQDPRIYPLSFLTPIPNKL
ncbi:hypothetical protein B0H10DRAFT_1019379 [Mycena sp. CBHHK59/15]|nr:hypothetical protein B0H10DRAFT_1019379 [Mycena sp. CBHHK59/15]